MKPLAFNKSTALLTAAAIADRGLLGVATLLTTVLLGRWSGPEELGLFSLFLPLAFAAIALQESLITAPYTILAADCGSDEARRGYLGSVLSLSAMLSLAATAILAAAATLLYGGRFVSYAAAAAALAVAVPCVLLREFARRVSYADLNATPAVLISGGASVVQLGLMAALHLAGRLTAVTAFVALGASSLLVGIAWIVSARHSFDLGGSSVESAFRRNWSLGRWMAAGQVGDVVRMHMFPWLLAAALDPASVGVYAACAAIAGLSQPLQVAISNVLLPQFSAVEARGGPAAADRLMWQATGWLLAAMTLFTLTIGSVSGAVVPLIYGPQYVGSQTPLVLLLLAQWIIGATLPAARALVALRRPDLDFLTHALSIGVNVAAGIPLVLWWGVAGAAAAALVGAAVKGALTAALYSRELCRGSLGSRPAIVAAAARAAMAPSTGGYAPIPASTGWVEDLV